VAKHKKSHPAPKPSARVGPERSVLRQSAKSIGRTIRLLQRQLEDVTKRLAAGNGTPPADGRRRSNGSIEGAGAGGTTQSEKRTRRLPASRLGDSPGRTRAKTPAKRLRR
jgi:hypothetical protein